MLTRQSSFLNKLRQQQSLGPSKQRLFYQLKIENCQPEITLSVASPQPGGLLEAVQSYRLQTMHLSQPPLFMLPEDVQILEALAAANISPASQAVECDVYFIQKPLGIDWLATLIATNRVFFADDSQPILWGEPAKVKMGWIIDEQGSQELTWLDSNGRLVIKTTDPCYWDETNHCIGKLTNALSPTAMELFLHTPRLASQEVDEFLAEHQETWRSLGLPLPDKLQITVTKTKPSPHLRLCSGINSGRNSDYLQIEYVYSCGNKKLPLPASDKWSVVTRYSQGKLRQVTRDTVLEKMYERQLHEIAEKHSTELQKQDEFHKDQSLSFKHHAQWQTFMIQGLPLLKRQGWSIEIEPGFRHHFVQPQKIEAHVSPKEQSWFELSLTIQIEGEPMALLPLLNSAIRKYSKNELSAMPPEHPLPFKLEDGRIVAIPVKRVLLWLSVLVELGSGRNDADTREHLSLPLTQLVRLTALEQDAELQWEDSTNLRARAQIIVQPPALSSFSLPATFKATPRPYQHLGIAWLQQRAALETGGILADDMGLGKTLQTLAHIAIEKEQGRLSAPVLVVAPSSVVSNWLAEVSRFTPELRCLAMTGVQRHQHWPSLQQYDLVITSYQLATGDIEKWRQQALHALFLDEAQMIKNPLAKKTIRLKTLDARYKICLTGTPMENHLGELWSLFDFIMPGLLDTQKNFTRDYRKPIEQEGDEERAKGLMQRTASFMLRRKKEEVATELPKKSEIIVRLQLEREQRDLYETLRLEVVTQLSEKLQEQQETQGRILILNALMQLRQLCCDPSLLKGQNQSTVTASAKREHLLRMIEELVDEGRTLLVFSQFTQMLDLIASDLASLEISTLMLTGKSRHRGELVKKFQAGEASVFLISLKAGGTGINLTRADTVIHYDPWWNSSAEQQATDRAYRIGQDKPVFVYKLLAEDTIEDKIHALQQSKQSLLNQVYCAAEGNSRQLAMDNQTLLNLLS